MKTFRVKKTKEYYTFFFKMLPLKYLLIKDELDINFNNRLCSIDLRSSTAGKHLGINWIRRTAIFSTLLCGTVVNRTLSLLHWETLNYAFVTFRESIRIYFVLSQIYIIIIVIQSFEKLKIIVIPLKVQGCLESIHLSGFPAEPLSSLNSLF